MEKVKIDTPFILFSILLFLLPIFFIPSSLVPFSYSKIMLLSVVILLALFWWAIVSFKEGKLVLPVNWFFLSILSIPVVVLLAALFSPNRVASLIGVGFEMDTLNFILLMSLLLFLISFFVRSKERIFYSYLWFGGAFLLVGLYLISRLFLGSSFLSFGYFTDIVSNPIGKWNDLAIFAGIGTLLSLVSLELLTLDRLFKSLLHVALVIGLFLLAVANFTIIWSTPITLITIIGIFALLFFVYSISSNRSSSPTSNRRIPLPSSIVLIFAVVFTIAAAPLGSALGSYFGINSIDVSPTWQSTFVVSKAALSKNPVLGIGPNRFDKQWDLSKPDGVNSTDFWNTDFNYGVGTVPTSLATGGILGLLSWLVFLVFLFYLGIRAVFVKIKDPFSLYLTLSSFLVAVYLWVINILYVPGMVIFTLAFVFTGLFVASLFREGILKERSIAYVQDSRKGFATILLLVIVLIGVIAWGYLLTEKVTAQVYANKAATELNNGNPQSAENYAVAATNFDRNPLYYRFLSRIELAKISSLIQGGASSETLSSQFQSLLNNAVTAASVATQLDSTDYQNWLSLAGVYESVIPLGIKDASTQAEAAYQEALKRNPQNPGIYLSLARIEAAVGNSDKARQYIAEALKLKNNYIDAIYLLAQIDLAAGKSNEALNDLNVAAAIAPNNPNVFFQLGSLNYNLGNFQAAATAFSQAIVIVPNYSDAKYYLGLSYYKLGRISDAIKQFEDVLAANPNNSAISTIISNLKAGRDPLASTATSTKK